jgi:hypothetical protein
VKFNTSDIVARHTINKQEKMTVPLTATILATMAKPSQRLASMQLLAEVPQERLAQATKMFGELLLENLGLGAPDLQLAGDDEVEKWTNVIGHFLPVTRGVRPDANILAIARDVSSLMGQRQRGTMRTELTAISDTHQGSLTIKSADMLEKEEKYVVLAPASLGRSRIRVVRNCQAPYQWLSPHHWCAMRTRGDGSAVVFAEWKEQLASFITTHHTTISPQMQPKQRRLIDTIKWWLDRFSTQEQHDQDEVRLYLSQVELVLENILLGARSDLAKGSLPSHGRVTAKFWAAVDAAWNGSVELDYLKFFTEARALGGASARPGQ